MRTHLNAHGQSPAEARAEGRMELLLMLLTVKFGEVPASIRHLVMHSPRNDVERWAVRLLTAPLLEDVFGASEIAAAEERATRRLVGDRKALLMMLTVRFGKVSAHTESLVMHGSIA